MYIQNRNKLTDEENKPVVTKGERKRGGTNMDYGINRYKVKKKKKKKIKNKFLKI